MLQLEHLYSGQTSLRPRSIKLVLFDGASLPWEVLRTSHLTGIQSVRTGSRLISSGEGVDRHSTSFGSKWRRLFILLSVLVGVAALLVERWIAALTDLGINRYL